MTAYFDTFPTPVGTFTVVVDDSGTILGTSFREPAGDPPTFDGYNLTRDPERLSQARSQLIEYFTGRRRTFELRLRPAGTPFQQAVWKALLEIPYGTTVSYADIARRIGHPKAFRAVGRANGANPICVLVPCHRVIGSNGTLTGFAFGPEMKRRLLEIEQPGLGI